MFEKFEYRTGIFLEDTGGMQSSQSFGHETSYGDMSLSHASVLLVDDYPDTLEMWALYLRACGYVVLTAADGNEAIRIATTELPSIVILDLDLPGISGYEAARRLRAGATTSQIPLIAATGYSHGRQLDEARSAGFDAVLIKPCDPTTLVHEIERVLEAAHHDPPETGQTGTHIR
jgi:CheY-like chemotaxis protein